MTTSWTTLCTDAPDLADAIIARFKANLHHILGTIRADGSVRLSGTEVTIDREHVGVGMMPGSRKLNDVRRDPRVELHSAPLEDDLIVGDAKMAGVLIESGETEGPPRTAFTLDVSAAGLVRVTGDQLEFTTWSPSTGLRVRHRR